MIANGKNDQILVFSPYGLFLRKFRVTVEPCSIVIDQNDNVFVTNAFHRVEGSFSFLLPFRSSLFFCDGSSFSFLSPFRSSLFFVFVKVELCSIAIDKNDNVFVADAFHRVEGFVLSFFSFFFSQSRFLFFFSLFLFSFLIVFLFLFLFYSFYFLFFCFPFAFSFFFFLSPIFFFNIFC